jgi:hypothetical protein
MKKYNLLFVALFILIVSIIISNITKISLDNTWLGNLSFLGFFATLLIFGWKSANNLKRKNKIALSVIIKICILIGIISSFVVLIAWIFGLMN